VSRELPWLLERAERAGEREALEVGGRAVSWAELALRARRAAQALRELGAEPGEALAVLLGNGLPFAVLLHASLLLGTAFLPLSPRLTARELAAQLAESGARLLLHGPAALAATARELARALPGLRLAPAEALANAAAKPLPDPAPPDPSATLAVLFTSGTSGRAKGAVLPVASFEASARASALHLGAPPGERWLACLPLHHVGGLSILLRSLVTGSTAVLHERFDAFAVSRALDRSRVTGVSLVPTLLARLLDARGPRPAPAALRCLLLGGGPAPLALLERARDLHFPVSPTYGLTEACSQVATRRPGDREGPLDAGLEPLPGTALRIVREDDSDAATGEPGEILVRSATLMRGYLGRPEESAHALRGGWLHTGDVGVLDARGRLRVLDRRSDLLVSGGENVYPAEVEAALLEHPAVREAGVAGVPDPEYGRRPAAWLVVEGEPPAPEALRAFCRERLAAYKVPVRFAFVQALPRSASGKLLRRELPGLSGEDPQ
jgi:O-succinylbenzoic acid--CoA ligase